MESKIRWIDNNENDKTKLRTNKSEDDLLCLEDIKAVSAHKNSFTTKSIIKPSEGIDLKAESKSVCFPNKPLEKFFQKADQDDKHYKSL